MDGDLRLSGATPLTEPISRWRDAETTGLDEAGRLVYRSRLLGADLAVTNFGGGNTSAKIDDHDPLTSQAVQVLWVKGSGGDLGSIGEDGFATLDMSRLRALDARYRGPAHEDGMPALLPHCVFGLNPRAASIDTPLHGLLPFAHIDHVHPDAVTALAAAEDGEALVRSLYGETIGWLAWRRPGWELARRLKTLVDADPGLKGVVLQSHGLITWGDTSEDCYETTIATVAAAARFLNQRMAGRPAFGGAGVKPLPAPERRAIAAAMLRRLRPLLQGAGSKVAHFADSPEVVEFAGSPAAERLAAIGTSCPDHFLRTKIRPLIVRPETSDAALRSAVEAYRLDYTAYYEACRRPDSPPIRDPDPVVFVAPGLGLFAFARDKATARVATEFFTNAINVMRGAEAVSRYIGLPDQEAFDIEYWSLEEAKLRRLPPAPPLQGKVAVVTGGAGGIGRAVAARLLADGACVFLLDIAETALVEAREALVAIGGGDRLGATACDVTDEAAVETAMADCVLRFGGVDILVANAGMAASAPITDTTLANWRQAFGVLVEGYFLASREAFKLMKDQGSGSIVFVVSKNGLVASPNASAYASAKAAELHLARCLALEGASHGIRVNSVNPDAVLRGSRIWSGQWKIDRAAAYGVEEDALEDYYRKRSLLQRPVYPEDVAEAVAFLAGSKSDKSTGNILNVDGGNLTAFVR